MSATYDVTGFKAVPIRRAFKLLRALWAAVQERRQRNKLRNALYNLSDTELKDIGMTRGEIGYVVSKRNIDLRGISPAGWVGYLPTVDGQIPSHWDK